MQLLFLRHAEPDYAIDGLTPEGAREADALARRVAAWRVSAFYQSPLGRAQATARPALAAHGAEATTCDWLREFNGPAHLQPDGSGHTTGCVWDLYPSYWTRDERSFAPEDWAHTAYMAGLPEDLPARRDAVVGAFDALLASWGYVREGRVYRVAPDARRGATLVFFCHLGVIGVLAGHALNVSPFQLWHSFFLPPASVTALNTEEREPGLASFRCQVMGDTSHLRAAGLAVSPMGGFQDDLFQG